jgi:hypothetical protein
MSFVVTAELSTKEIATMLRTLLIASVLSVGVS